MSPRWVPLPPPLEGDHHRGFRFLKSTLHPCGPPACTMVPARPAPRPAAQRKCPGSHRALRRRRCPRPPTPLRHRPQSQTVSRPATPNGPAWGRAPHTVLAGGDLANDLLHVALAAVLLLPRGLTTTGFMPTGAVFGRALLFHTKWAYVCFPKHGACGAEFTIREYLCEHFVCVCLFQPVIVQLCCMGVAQFCVAHSGKLACPVDLQSQPEGSSLARGDPTPGRQPASSFLSNQKLLAGL